MDERKFGRILETGMGLIMSCVLLSLNFAGLSISSTMRILAAPLPARMPVICAWAEACSKTKNTVKSGTILPAPVKIRSK